MPIARLRMTGKTMYVVLACVVTMLAVFALSLPRGEFLLPTLDLQGDTAAPPLFGSAVSTSGGVRVEIFSDTEAGAGIVAPRDQHNIFRCASGGQLLSGGLQSDTATRFWIYEYSGREGANKRAGKINRELFDGRFFLSAGERAATAGKYDALHTLAGFSGSKMYYLMAARELSFTCGSGIALHARCGNGSVENGEVCDDGNDSEDDGCDTSCAVGVASSSTSSLSSSGSSSSSLSSSTTSSAGSGTSSSFAQIQLGKVRVQPNIENNGGVPPSEQTLTPDFGGYVPFPQGPLSVYMQRIDSEPVDHRSDAIMAIYQPGGALETRKIYPEGMFGHNELEYGLPFNVVAGDQPMVPVFYDNPNEAYPNESDPGPMPIPPDAAVQSAIGTPTTPPSSDGHLVIVDRDNHLLYELYKAYKDPVTNAWHAGAGAVWDLANGGGGFFGAGNAHVNPGQLRPLGWTSADAAGLPIFPFLVRYDEVSRGEIRHALRATFSPGRVAGRYVYPARHYAGGSRTWNETTLPYGARLRLKQSWYDANKDTFGPQSRVIVDAMRRYGIFNSDIGIDFSLAGVQDSRWDKLNDISRLQSIPAHAFEVVAMPDDYTIAVSPSIVTVGQPVTVTVTYNFREGENVNSIETYITDTLLNGACIACGTANLTPAQPTGTFTYTPSSAGAKRIYLVDFPGGMMYTPADVTAVLAIP